MADPRLSCRTTDLTIFGLPRRDIVFGKIFSRMHLDEIYRCRMTSRHFKELCDEFFRTMRTLDIHNVRSSSMNSEVLERLAVENTSLRNLILNNCRFLLEEYILVDIFRRNPQIQKLNLSRCRMLTSVVLFKLADFCSELKELYLLDCVWVSPNAIMKIFKYCPDLETLDLARCTRINDECILSLAQHCPKLKFVSLNFCTAVTDKSLTLLAANSPELKHVGLSGCVWATDMSLRALATECHSLHFVEVDSCNSMTRSGVEFLWKKGIETDVTKDIVLRSKFWS